MYWDSVTELSPLSEAISPIMPLFDYRRGDLIRGGTIISCGEQGFDEMMKHYLYF